MLLKISIIMIFLFLLGQRTFAQESCPNTPADCVRLAATFWGADSPQSHFRVCNDTVSCFSESCSTQLPSYNTTTSRLSDYHASDPFIMKAKNPTFAKAGACKGKGVVVLAHGYGSAPEALGGVADALTRDGYNVVSLLLSGHGDSFVQKDPCSTIQPEKWRADIKNGLKLAAQVFPGCPLFMGGHSTGGALAVDYLQTHQGQQTDGFPTPRGAFLFDPALALPFVNEIALTMSIAYSQGHKEMKIAKNYVDSQPISQSNNPTHTAIPKGCAVAIQQLNMDIRDRAGGYKDAPVLISTPVFAAFSNGKNEGVKASKMIDATEAAKKLKKFTSAPEVFSNQDLTHNGLIGDPAIQLDTDRISNGQNIGCDLAGDGSQSTVNPKFNQMMGRILHFLSSQRGASSKTVGSPPLSNVTK